MSIVWNYPAPSCSCSSEDIQQFNVVEIVHLVGIDAGVEAFIGGKQVFAII